MSQNLFVKLIHICHPKPKATALHFKPKSCGKNFNDFHLEAIVHNLFLRAKAMNLVSIHKRRRRGEEEGAAASPSWAEVHFTRANFLKEK